MKTEQIIDAIKEALLTPTTAAGGVTTMWTLNQWVALATGVWIVLQAAYLLRKWYREEREYSDSKK